MAEIVISIVARQYLCRRIDSVDMLNLQLSAWTAERNINRTSVNWQFTAVDARFKLRRRYPQL